MVPTTKHLFFFELCTSHRDRIIVNSRLVSFVPRVRCVGTCLGSRIIPPCTRSGGGGSGRCLTSPLASRVLPYAHHLRGVLPCTVSTLGYGFPFADDLVALSLFGSSPCKWLVGWVGRSDSRVASIKPHFGSHALHMAVMHYIRRAVTSSTVALRHRSNPSGRLPDPTGREPRFRLSPGTEYSVLAGQGLCTVCRFGRYWSGCRRKVLCLSQL